MVSGFIERTILGTVSVLKDTVSVERYALQRGFLQERDPRYKSCASISLLIAMVLCNNAAVLLSLYAIIVLLVPFSNIRIGFFLKRTLLFVPIFSFVIVVPAIFDAVSPGTVVASWHVFGLKLSVTRQGIDAAGIFCMRVLDCVSMSVLLVLTTRQHVLLKVLRIFKVPQLFVMTIGMSYRYIFLFLDIIQKMFIGIKSRVGFVSSSTEGRRIATAHMAGLWLRSYRLHTAVYDAMISRGYNGEAYVLDEFRSTIADKIMLILSFIILIGAVWANRFFH